jgi:putative nucleotidyltransferase with HDIG domain
MAVDSASAERSAPAAKWNTMPSVSLAAVSDHATLVRAGYLPEMLLATTLVAVTPLLTSLTLRATGVITSAWLSLALAMSMSVTASAAGNAYWRKHGTGEMLFSELLLWGWIRRWRQEHQLANATSLLELANPQAIAGEGAISLERREQLLVELAGALEGQDVYLNGHSRRVARHATMIARRMGLPGGQVARIRVAAAVHDVGKLRTPKRILNKPGPLTDAEFEAMKRHPVDGAEMVSALGDAELTRIVRHHHERLDGAGYPDGLAGDGIPLGARIIAVADTFDAITSARAYRAASSHQKAIDILRKEAGSQLDPDAVGAFLAYYSGNRPTAAWALLIGFLRRLVAWLSGDPAAAATLSAGKVAAVTAATAAIGAAAAATPVPALRLARPPVAARKVAAPLMNNGADRQSSKMALVTTRAHSVPIQLAPPTGGKPLGAAHPAHALIRGATHRGDVLKHRATVPGLAAAGVSPDTLAGKPTAPGSTAPSTSTLPSVVPIPAVPATSSVGTAEPAPGSAGTKPGSPPQPAAPANPTSPPHPSPPPHPTPLPHPPPMDTSPTSYPRPAANPTPPPHPNPGPTPAANPTPPPHPSPPPYPTPANPQEVDGNGSGNAGAGGGGDGPSDTSHVAPREGDSLGGGAVGRGR